MAGRFSDDHAWPVLRVHQGFAEAILARRNCLYVTNLAMVSITGLVLSRKPPGAWAVSAFSSV